MVSDQRKKNEKEREVGKLVKGWTEGMHFIKEEPDYFMGIIMILLGFFL